MNRKFVTTPTFDKSYKRLKKKYISIKDDLTKFEKEFSENPKLGVDLGDGYRKVRMAIKSKNSGKRGGARIITYDLCIKEENNNIILVDIYDKSEIDTLHEKIYKSIIEIFLTEYKK